MEQKKKDLSGGTVIGILFLVALLIALVMWYVQHFSTGYALAGSLFGVPFGAAVAGGIGGLRGLKRECIEIGPLPLMQHAKGISALRKAYLPGPTPPPFPAQAELPGTTTVTPPNVVIKHTAVT